MITNQRVTSFVGDQSSTVEVYNTENDKSFCVNVNGYQVVFRPRTYGGDINDTVKSLAEALAKVIAE